MGNTRYRVSVTVRIEENEAGAGWSNPHELNSVVEGSLATIRELEPGALARSMCREGMEIIAPRPVIGAPFEVVPGST